MTYNMERVVNINAQIPARRARRRLPVRRAPTSRQPGSGRESKSSSNQSLLRHLSQSATQNREIGARQTRSGASGKGRADLGAGRSQASRRNDAAAWSI